MRFFHRLARDQGKTPSELLRNISGAREFASLMAYYDIEPPESKVEQMLGLILCGIYNSSGNFKKTFRVKDFVPQRRRMFITRGERLAEMKQKVLAAFGKGTDG